MSMTGTIYAWNGSAWVLTASEGGGGGGGSFSAYEEVVLAHEPVAFWPLQETDGGVAEDITENNHHGIWSGGTPTASGPGTARAMIFDGVNDHIDIISSAPFRTANFTAEAWIKMNDSDWNCIVAHDVGGSGPYGYSMFVKQTDGFIRGEIDAGGGASDRYGTTDVSDDDWHYVVFTNDGTNTKIYVDAVLEDTTAEGGTMSYYTTSAHMRIGAQNGNQYWFTGSLSNIALYDRALSLAEIQEHYDAIDGSVGNPVDGYGDEPEQIIEHLFTGGTTTGWTIVETWDQSPSDYQHATGSGSGYTVMHRAMQSGTIYAETDVYMSHTGAEWVALRINHPNGSAATASDADGVLMRGNGEILIPWSGGSDAAVGAGNLDEAPQAAADRVAIGVYDDGTGTIRVYVNRVLRRTYTGCTNRVGTHIAIAVWNGGEGHFHKVREYDALPF